MFRIEHNIETGKINEIALSPAEIAELKKIAEQSVQDRLLAKNEADSKAQEKAALLAKLGITEDEAKLLLS